MNLGRLLTGAAGVAVVAGPMLLAVLNPAPVYAQNRPVCATTATDTDRDGWGFENGESCQVVNGQTVGAGAARPVCSSNAADGGGGWGFENGATCIFPLESSVSSIAASRPERPACGAEAVDNRDGWGWQDGQSCRWPDGGPTLSGAAAGTTTRPECSADAIDNGGGWGWENGESCRWSEGQPNQPSAQPDQSVSAQPANDDVGQVSSASNAAADIVIGGTDEVRECSANAFDSGGGWGFEYGASCRWGSVRPASSDSNSGAAPPPVAAASNGFVDGDPICLTDSSDGNHDGFGYENNRTCQVVDGVTATPADPLLNTRWCQPWAEIAYGDYVLQNNTWNDSEVYTDDWSQCIEVTGGPGRYIAKWDYNWLPRDGGNEYSVKSYPQVYYGRKTRNTRSGTVERLGLPANINNLPQFRVRYKYSETGNAERNVALESFFHTSCEAEEWNKHFELMVWVNSPVTKTPGTPVTEVTLDGKEWLVYVNPSLGWGYVAFVEKTPSQEGWLDWNAFVNWTRYEGPAYGIWPIGNNTCMGAIEIGTETFWGTGTFTLEEFRVVRQ